MNKRAVAQVKKHETPNKSMQFNEMPITEPSAQTIK